MFAPPVAIIQSPRQPQTIVPFPSLQSIFHDAIKKEYLTLESLEHIRSVAASKDGTVWVGGFNGKVAKSTNFGQNWVTLEPAQDGKKTELQFRGIAILEIDVVCAMAAGESKNGHSRVYRSTDGGATWTLVLFPTDPGYFFSAIRFWDKDNGLVLSDPRGGNFIIYRTTDGGLSWEQISTPAFPGEAAFAASNTCLTVFGSNYAWFCTNLGRVFYSMDQGKSWEVSTTPMEIKSPTAGLFSIAFKNEDEGIAVGGDCIAKTHFPSSNVFLTSDGGRIWKPAPLESLSTDLSGNYLSCVAYNDSGKAFAIDGSKELLHTVTFVGSKGYATGPNGKIAVIMD